MQPGIEAETGPAMAPSIAEQSVVEKLANGCHHGQMATRNLDGQATPLPNQRLNHTPSADSSLW